jgi:hypothetical protein
MTSTCRVVEPSWLLHLDAHTPPSLPPRYHKQQVTIHDDDPANHIFKKTPEQMFEMKMQLKYGSPLVGECFAWGHETDWVTTMRPDGLERGLIKVGKREMERTQGRA